MMYEHDRGGEDQFESPPKNWAAEYILGPLHEQEPHQDFAAAARLPTPPLSASPTRPSFFRSRASSEDEEKLSPLKRLFSKRRSPTIFPSPPSPLLPPSPSQSTLELDSAFLPRSRPSRFPVHTIYPPPTRWSQGTILQRSSSGCSSQYSFDTMSKHVKPVRRSSSVGVGAQAHCSSSLGLQRGGSLRERYPGDMSHRPLDILRREYRAPDRQPHLHNRHRRQPSDLIDSLDMSAGIPYHHDGPYDATLKSRNINKMYSPVEAVKESNTAALKATPPENILDSLERHYPLQGTSVIPPGMRDLKGNPMEYEDGADMMRELDAPGGAYRRYDGIKYLDQDLKGKGEPSFTVERDHKERKARLNSILSPTSVKGPSVYEMQSGSHPGHRGSKGTGKEAQDRQRSLSQSTPRYMILEEYPYMVGSSKDAGSLGVGRFNTNGKSGMFSGLKSKFGSLRRRRV